MPLLMLLQTCRHNFLDKVKIRIRAVKAHTWKELIEQAETTEKSAKILNPQYPRTNWGSTPRAWCSPISQPKRKETMTVELSGAAQLKQKGGTSGNQDFKFPPKVYSFKDEQVVIIFHLLHKGNKLKLPEVRWPNEVGRTNDANYCLFHKMVHHPTSKFFILKDKIQRLVDAGVLTFKSE